MAFLASLVPGCGAGKPEAHGPAPTSADILAAAEELEKEQQTRQAFAAYHQILKQYPDTPEGKKAAERIRRARQESAPKRTRRTRN